ncbi:acyltransferase [Pseudomonas sp. J452]|uniref:acyltransferase family protein n=1 Tax=Pseudomonas sp. J452 TaxID=2898441 RepID=UPI0021ADD904|nr:acyltransferase [Pseudomonas sp. J452]UUY09342.1 acyltransferase [Pseudomonas sp. J452]
MHARSSGKFLNRVEHFRPLDGLRGVAILLVLLYHVWGGVSGISQMQSDFLLLSFLYAGNTGVTLFFLLSGFLVSRPFFHAAQRKQLPSLRHYFLQRALRVLPPYYVVGLVGIFSTQQFDQLLPLMSLSVRGYELGSFSVVWWSLIAEVQFYLLLPLLFVGLRSRYYRLILVLMAMICLALYLGVVNKLLFNRGVLEFEVQYHLILSVIGQMPAFLVGMLLAVLSMRDGQRFKLRAPRLFLCALLFLLAVLLLPAARMGPAVYIWHAPWSVLLEALLWGAVMWVMLVREQPRFSFLDNRLTRYCGRISFSLYLVHMPVMQLVKKHFDFDVFGGVLLTLLLSIVLAQILYWLIEKPSLALKNKLHQPKFTQEIKV